MYSFVIISPSKSVSWLNEHGEYAKVIQWFSVGRKGLPE